MKKKIFSLGLLSLMALSLASCGGENTPTGPEQPIDVNSAIDQSVVNQRKTELEQKFNEIIQSLEINSKSEYYATIKAVYDEGVTALGEATGVGILNSTYKNYVSKLETAKKDVQKQIDAQGLAAAKVSYVEALRQYGENKLKESGFADAQSAPDEYQTVLANAEKIINAVTIFSNNALDVAYTEAQLQLDKDIVAVLSNTSSVDASRNERIKQVLDYAKAKIANKADNGDIYSVASIYLEKINGTYNLAQMDGFVNEAKKEIDKLTVNDTDLSKYALEKTVFSNTFTNANTVVPCINGNTLYPVYGKVFNYTEALNKGTRQYFDNYINEIKEEANVSVDATKGLYLYDKNADGADTGYGVEAVIDFDDIALTKGAFKLHFDIDIVRKSSWSMIKLYDNSGNVMLEICATKSYDFGYRLGTSGDRITIGGTDATHNTTDNDGVGVPTELDGYTSIDVLMNVSTKTLTITAKNGDVVAETVLENININSFSKIVAETNASQQIDVIMKNVVVSKTENELTEGGTTGSTEGGTTGGETDTLESRILAAKNDLEAYKTTALTGKTDDGSVEAAYNVEVSKIEAATLETIDQVLADAKIAIDKAVAALPEASTPQVENYKLDLAALNTASSTVAAGATYKLDDTITINAGAKEIKCEATRVNLSGGSVKTNYGIEVTLKQAGVVKIIGAVSKNSNVTQVPKNILNTVNNSLAYYDASGNKIVVDTPIQFADDNTTVTEVYLEAGTYRFGGSTAGIYIYSLEIDYSAQAAAEVTLKSLKARYVQGLTFIENSLEATTGYGVTITTEAHTSFTATTATTKAELKEAYETAVDTIMTDCKTAMKAYIDTKAAELLQAAGKTTTIGLDNLIITIKNEIDNSNLDDGTYKTTFDKYEADLQTEIDKIPAGSIDGGSTTL